MTISSPSFSSRNSTRSPLTNTPLRLRSSSARAFALAVDDGVPARDRRVVEADVRGEAAPDTSEPLLERHDAEAIVCLEGDVVTLLDECRARLLEPLGPGEPGRRGRVGGVVVAEDRRALELARAAVRAGRDRVSLEQGDRVGALLALEGAGARQRSGHDRLHLSPPDGGRPVYRAPPSGAMGAAGSRSLALAPSVESRAVDSVTVRTHISAPREQVYALIADVAARHALRRVHDRRGARAAARRRGRPNRPARAHPNGLGVRADLAFDRAHARRAHRVERARERRRAAARGARLPCLHAQAHSSGARPPARDPRGGRLGGALARDNRRLRAAQGATLRRAHRARIPEPLRRRKAPGRAARAAEGRP